MDADLVAVERVSPDEKIGSLLVEERPRIFVTKSDLLLCVCSTGHEGLIGAVDLVCQIGSTRSIGVANSGMLSARRPMPSEPK